MKQIFFNKKKLILTKNIKISFKFKSFHHYNFDLLIPKLLKKLNTLNLFFINFVSLPTKLERYTVLRSPHVDKKSREQFEIRSYTKFLTVFFNFNSEIEKQKAKLLINFIKNSASGFQIKMIYHI